MIRIGTSGYSYDDWIGPFYPEGTKKNKFLEYYKQHFDTTELNFTFYRMPTKRMLATIGNKVAADFLFSVKATNTITHDREDDPRSTVKKFNEALSGLKDEGKLACVLAQFPSSFHANDKNRDYLKRLRSGFGDTPVVIEFRHRDWISEDTFDLLKDLGFGFCCVDQPQFDTLLPPVAISTSSVAYVRLHGRNYAKWWHHKEAWERYNYAYKASELREWVPRLKALDVQKDTELTLVYLNNHWEGQAPASAKLMQKLLTDADADV
jgi:uncharacterized protein YecE (DUF72 family)